MRTLAGCKVLASSAGLLGAVSDAGVQSSLSLSFSSRTMRPTIFFFLRAGCSGGGMAASGPAAAFFTGPCMHACMHACHCHGRQHIHIIAEICQGQVWPLLHKK